MAMPALDARTVDAAARNTLDLRKRFAILNMEKQGL
jgi:hypothetical protein